MAATSVFWLIILPMVIGSIAVAISPLRPVRIRIAVLGGHVLISLTLITLLDGPRPLWIMVFGPGLAIAGCRLSAIAIRAGRTAITGG